MRDSIRAFVSLGPLPNEAAAVETIKRHQEALLAITRPVSLEEANQLATMFGPDDCFGLGWSLLHQIESAPSWAAEGVIPQGPSPWPERLRERIRNAQ